MPPLRLPRTTNSKASALPDGPPVEVDDSRGASEPVSCRLNRYTRIGIDRVDRNAFLGRGEFRNEHEIVPPHIVFQTGIEEWRRCDPVLPFLEGSLRKCRLDKQGVPLVLKEERSLQ